MKREFDTQKKEYTLSILVQDTPGVLSQVAVRRRTTQGTQWVSDPRFAAEGGRARQYAPAVPREQAALEETESLLRRVYRGSVGMMVNTLADGRGLTDEDIEELSAVLEKARRERK